MSRTKPIKYDDVAWHRHAPIDPEKPADSAVHIGMFVGWSIEMRLVDSDFASAYAEDLASFGRRETTGGRIVEECCDGKLTNDFFNEDGNLFAKAYYESGNYYADFDATFTAMGMGDVPIEDSWENYETIKDVLDHRYVEWKETCSAKGGR